MTAPKPPNKKHGNVHEVPHIVRKSRIQKAWFLMPDNFKNHIQESIRSIKHMVSEPAKERQFRQGTQNSGATDKMRKSDVKMWTKNGKYGKQNV